MAAYLYLPQEVGIFAINLLTEGFLCPEIDTEIDTEPEKACKFTNLVQGSTQIPCRFVRYQTSLLLE